jgi:hypothetical protein
MEIDKNIPMPPQATRSKRGNSYQWGDMEIGDSVFFDNEPSGSGSHPAMGAKTFAWRQGKGAKFSARKEGNGVRIWRVA